MVAFSKMNSRQENHSKLSFTARIITKYSLERFLSICGEKISKGFLREDVSKYQPEVYKSEKSKILKKIHKVALGKLLT